MRGFRRDQGHPWTLTTFPRRLPPGRTASVAELMQQLLLRHHPFSSRRPGFSGQVQLSSALRTEYFRLSSLCLTPVGLGPRSWPGLTDWPQTGPAWPSAGTCGREPEPGLVMEARPGPCRSLSDPEVMAQESLFLVWETPSRDYGINTSGGSRRSRRAGVVVTGCGALVSPVGSCVAAFPTWNHTRRSWWFLLVRRGEMTD